MPLQNRVTPDGRIIADTARGMFMGNRGVLHDDQRRVGKARWRHANWVTCVLQFRGRHRKLMTPMRYTELFFLDEAVALAAGHRPCGECRHGDYVHYKSLWMAAHGIREIMAKDMDRALQAERAVPREARQRRHRAEISDLPDGAFVMNPDGDAGPCLIYQGCLLPYSTSGYEKPIEKPKRGQLTLLTPPGTVEVLRRGFKPVLHSSAVQG